LTKRPAVGGAEWNECSHLPRAQADARGRTRDSRSGGRASPRGAFLDSVADRCAEFATFLGLGAFFRGSWVQLAVAIAAFASLMVSYTRARAEGLGFALQVGRAQRPERYVVLGFGGWLSGLVAHLACPVIGRPTHVVLAGS